MTLIAPLWLMMPTGPSAGITSVNMVEKLGTAPLPKLARPWELGPTMRMPRARARAAIASSRALPCGSLSPKPELITMQTATPASPHSSTAAMACSPATATTTTSGTSGSEARSGKQCLPCTSVRVGLIG